MEIEIYSEEVLLSLLKGSRLIGCKISDDHDNNGIRTLKLLFDNGLELEVYANWRPYDQVWLEVGING